MDTDRRDVRPMPMDDLQSLDGVLAWAEEHAQATPERILCRSNDSLCCVLAKYYAERLGQEVDDSGMGVDGWVKVVGDEAAWFRDDGSIEDWTKLSDDFQALVEYVDRYGAKTMTAREVHTLLGRFVEWLSEWRDKEDG